MAKLLSLINGFYGLVALFIIFFASNHDSLGQALTYLFLYALVPLFLSLYLWRSQVWAGVIAGLFYLSHAFKSLNSASWLPYSPPISFGIPVGSYSQGSAYLIDLFAIAMLGLLIILMIKDKDART
jgi:hypothetical protein